MDSILGYAPGTLELLYAVEKVLANVGLAQRQQVLSGALWRSVTAHPCLAMTVDMDVQSITLTRGGRRLSLEMAMFPPAGTRLEPNSWQESPDMAFESPDEAFEPAKCPLDCRGLRWGEEWPIPRGSELDGRHHPACRFNAAWEKRHVER